MYVSRLSWYKPEKLASVLVLFVNGWILFDDGQAASVCMFVCVCSAKTQKLVHCSQEERKVSKKREQNTTEHEYG